MKISQSQLERVLAHYQTGIKKPMEKKAQPQDQLTLSSEAKLVKEVQEAIKGIPEVRNQKVQEIKKAIEAGEYKVSSQDVAEKMMQRMMVDNLIEGKSQGG